MVQWSRESAGAQTIQRPDGVVGGLEAIHLENEWNITLISSRNSMGKTFDGGVGQDRRAEPHKAVAMGGRDLEDALLENTGETSPLVGRSGGEIFLES